MPWQEHVAISPMSTRPKKGNSNKRRIIMDMSWPRDGTAVNEGISTHTYLEQTMELVYPTIDNLCKKAAQLGKGCWGYKKDLKRAFKQLGMDPGDWPLLGIVWRSLIYFDKSAVMGSRSAPYACQRTTTFVRHVMRNLQYNLFNYVDDFMGLELQHRVWVAFNTLGNLLRDLGVGEAEEKSVEPTQLVEFLGVLFNLKDMIISVTPERMQDLKIELTEWANRTQYARKDLEQLLGRLQFISACVRPGRVMVMRLRNNLPSAVAASENTVTQEMLKDINWWRLFLPVFDNTSYMWMSEVKKPDALLATDSSLKGMGATCGNMYTYFIYTDQVKKDYGIVQLEMLAILASVRLWINTLRGRRFTILCDNMACVDMLRFGYTSEPMLQNLLRHVTMECACAKMEIIPEHIKSKQNRLPDLLSRAHDINNLKLFQLETLGTMKYTAMPVELFADSDIW